MPEKKTNTDPPHNHRSPSSPVGSSHQESQDSQHGNREKLPEDPAFADTGAQNKTSQASSPIAGAASEGKKKKDSNFMRFIKKIAFSVWAVVMAIGMVLAFLISLFLV